VKYESGVPREERYSFGERARELGDKVLGYLAEGCIPLVPCGGYEATQAFREERAALREENRIVADVLPALAKEVDYYLNNPIPDSEW
jgi:hypothetical protein